MTDSGQTLNADLSDSDNQRLSQRSQRIAPQCKQARNQSADQSHHERHHHPDGDGTRVDGQPKNDEFSTSLSTGHNAVHGDPIAHDGRDEAPERSSD